jgi:hypothetical protein
MSGSGWSNGSITLVIITEVPGVLSGLFLYSPTVAKGNLVGSWTVNAGTDPAGNTYPAGFNVQDGSSQVVINALAGLVTEQFLTGNPNTGTPATISAATLDTGTDETDVLTISSARLITSVGGDSAFITLTAGDMHTNPASVKIGYDPAGASLPYTTLTSTAGGSELIGSVYAAEPGLLPVAAEIWHTPASLDAGWTVTGAAQPVRYRLEPTGCVRLDGEVLTTGTGPWPANADIFTLPSEYAPTESCPFITRSDIAVAAGQDTVDVLSSGSVQNGQVFTAAGQRLFLTGVVFPVT